jgi:tetratricopeptide (TPR) repeat protein
MLKHIRTRTFLLRSIRWSFTSCVVFCAWLISTEVCAGQRGSLAEADQDFQRAQQIWGNGQSPEAEALLNHALAIRRDQLGPGDPKVAEVIERLGALSFNRGKYGEAEEHFRKALDIDVRALGERNIATSYIMGDVGAALREQHRCNEAQTIVERSLTIYRDLLPPNSPLMATRLNNLARIYLCERRYADARQALQTSLAIYSNRSIEAGIRSDQALLERVMYAERGGHEPLLWALMLGTGAFVSLVLLGCSLWSNYMRGYKEKKPMRQDLVEAMEQCRREIDILRNAGKPIYGGGGAPANTGSRDRVVGERVPPVGSGPR